MQSTRRASVRRGLGCVVIASVVAVGCGSDDSGSDSTSGAPGASTGSTDAESESLLGTPNPATGEPIRIGYATTGENDTIDYRYEEDATNAVIEYLNEYRGGIGGRPIELLQCEDGRAEARISTCVNEMIDAEVPLVVTPSTANATLYARSFTEAGIPWVLNQAAEPAALTSPGIFVLTNSPASTLDVPARIARDEGIEEIVYLVIDSPGLVDALQTRGEEVYDAAGVGFDLIGVAPGTADMTPQVAAALQSDPGAVMVVGNVGFCISALTALETNGFTGETLLIPQCVDRTVNDAVPGGLEGTRLISFGTSDADDPDVRLRDAIYAEYAPDDILVDGLTDGAFQTFMSVQAVLADMTGEITPETVRAAFEQMPSQPYPLGAGIAMQCNGQQVPDLVSVCSHEVLASVFNADGVAVDAQIVDPVS